MLDFVYYRCNSKDISGIFPKPALRKTEKCTSEANSAQKNDRAQAGTVD